METAAAVCEIPLAQRLSLLAGQLASDCHDLFDAPHSRDLANGTRTLPIALHLERLRGRPQDRLLSLLDRARLHAGAQAQVRRTLRQAGTLRHCALAVEVHCQRARPAFVGETVGAGRQRFAGDDPARLLFPETELTAKRRGPVRKMDLPCFAASIPPLEPTELAPSFSREQGGPQKSGFARTTTVRKIRSS